MSWLKRNLFLVVGGVVAIALLGVAGFYLYSKIQQNQEVTDKLKQSTDQLKTLVNRDPHPGAPGVDNIGAAKQELKKLEAFAGEMRRYFPKPSTNYLGNREFRARLDNTIDTLQHEAEKAGVKIPHEYWFTFAAQKTSVNFATNTLAPLTSQLEDIKALCDILYDAKVISVVGLKRVAVATEDTGADYLTVKATTNLQYAVLTPYEVTFDSFSAELARVLEGLERSTNNCFVVKNVIVAQVSKDELQQSATPVNPMPSAGNPYSRYFPGMNPGLAARYGGRPQPAPVPVAPVQRPAARGGLTTALDEKMLRITLALEAVKLKPLK